MADNEHIERLLILTRDLERELAGRAHDLDRHARGSAALVRALVLIMGVLALANLWFVYDLTQEIRQVIAGMDEMRGHFGRVSARMADIQARTAAMEQDVGLMPVVGAQMQQIGGDLDHMRAAVACGRHGRRRGPDGAAGSIEEVDGFRRTYLTRPMAECRAGGAARSRCRPR